MSQRRAAVYVRVAAEPDPTFNGLERQKGLLIEYAELHDCDIVAVYEDIGSGLREDRPGLQHLLADAEAGLMDVVLMRDPSRLFRDPSRLFRDWSLFRQYEDELRNKLNIEILFVTQPVTDDPTEFTMETLEELFDEYHRNQLRVWTTLGKQARAQRGLYNGTLPFGYMLGDDGVPVPHQRNAEGVVMAFQAYSTGRYTDAQIAELLNREGYRTTGNWGERPFTKDTVNRMLKNVFYLGYVKYKGELIPGQHPPLIEQELFDTCQEMRGQRARKPKAGSDKKRVYILAGLARCYACQLTLRSSSTQSSGGYRYYRHTARERGYDCSVPGKMVRGDALEQQWAAIISTIQLPDDWKQHIEALAGGVEQRQHILREREAIQEQLRRLKLIYRGLLMDEAEYRASRDDLEARLTQLVPPGESQPVITGMCPTALGTLWAAATLEEQRALSQALARAVYVDVVQARITAVEPQPVFKGLFAEGCAALGVSLL